MEKHEWRKAEKDLYLPKSLPAFVTVPPCTYFSLRGSGNPNDSYFAEYIGVLYALSYAVKMSLKRNSSLELGLSQEGYCDYTVYPLEGVWDITDEAKIMDSPALDKNSLVFDLMIRQPGFVTEDFAYKILQQVSENKPHELLQKIQFSRWEEGLCVQMLHIGSYDNEPASFRTMEEFAQRHDVHRISKVHREIYLTDARKTLPEKQKTVLRFQVVK